MFYLLSFFILLIIKNVTVENIFINIFKKKQQNITKSYLH